MIKLIWFVATISATGPVSGEIPDTRTFKTVTECVSYAKEMEPRMKDWIRGALRADWDHPVDLKPQCAGDPA